MARLDRFGLNKMSPDELRPGGASVSMFEQKSVRFRIPPHALYLFDLRRISVSDLLLVPPVMPPHFAALGGLLRTLLDPDKSRDVFVGPRSFEPSHNGRVTDTCAYSRMAQNMIGVGI